MTLDSEDDWKKGPAHVNALIAKKEEEILGRGATLDPPPIPAEMPGVAWDIDKATGLFTPAYRHSDETSEEIDDLERQRPYLLECAQDLCKSIEGSTSNRAKAVLLKRGEDYAAAIDKHSSMISIDEVYAVGVRLRNAAEQMRREVEDEGMPHAAAEIGEAVNSVIGLHGPFVLSTRRGREADARARSHNRTRQQELDYKLKAEEFAKSIDRTAAFVHEDGKSQLKELSEAVGTGPFPERSTMLSESANTNLIATASKVVVTEYSAAVMLGTPAGKAATVVGIQLANTVAAWMLANQSLLVALAMACPESLGWLPYFITWLRTKFG